MATGVAVDASGEVVVTGSFTGTVNFGGGALSTPNTSADVFVVKYGGAGEHRWSKQLGGTMGDISGYVAVDDNGKPTSVPAFKPKNKAEEQRVREAQERRDARLQLSKKK